MRAKYGILFLLCLMLVISPVMAKEQVVAPLDGDVLTFDEFIACATKNDTEFEQILIDELSLCYEKAIRLPAKDLVLSVKQQHEFYFDQERESPDTTVSLSKLFPYTGSQFDVAYEAGASVSSRSVSSEISYGLSQPIAQNAFGRSTRMLDKIVGLEVIVARHQIVEAYEDYMALIVKVYYDWYASYENVKVARAAYAANVRLLDNIYERQKQKIALPVDVNKVKLQVVSKQERLVSLEEEYDSNLNAIERIIRYNGATTLVPSDPRAMADSVGDFEQAFNVFSADSRTFEVLRTLEEKSHMQVARDADALLPSIDLLIGYEVSGKKYMIEDENNFFYVGAQFDWAIGEQVDGAEYERSKIVEHRTKLSTTNTYYRLYSQLYDVYLQMTREQKLLAIADDRIAMAKAIVEDEQENYSYGKISLNDYIQAVNVLDTSRFNKISHEMLHKKLLVEWLRLTDRLVRSREMREKFDGVRKNI